MEIVSDASQDALVYITPMGDPQVCLGDRVEKIVVCQDGSVEVYAKDECLQKVLRLTGKPTPEERMRPFVIQSAKDGRICGRDAATGEDWVIHTAQAYLDAALRQGVKIEWRIDDEERVIPQVVDALIRYRRTS